MSEGLLTLVRKCAELQGRAIEIISRIRHDAESLEAMQRELSLVWAAMEPLLNSSEPPPMAVPVSSPRMLRLPEVSRRIGLARSSVWALVKAGRFPAPRHLSARAVGWWEREVDDWLALREALTPKGGARHPHKRLHR
jgi:prophage regulatory protein